MQLAGPHYAPASDRVSESPEGVWFIMSDGESHVRCLVERSAWRARALNSRDMMDAVARNWAEITTLASRKLLQMEQPQTELHLTADDLFRIAWRERR